MNIPAGTKQKSVDVQIVDDSGLAVTGLVAATFPDVYYSKGGTSAAVQVTLADLAAITTAWTSGGVKERSGGWYRLDLPNAALNAAATVRIIGDETDKHLLAESIQVEVNDDITVVGHNLTRLRTRLTKERSHVMVWGDSTSTMSNSPRLFYGWIREWDVQVNGIAIRPGTTAGNEGALTFGHEVTTMVDPGELLGDGVTVNPFPFPIASLTGISNMFGYILRFIPSVLNEYVRGDWTAGRDLTMRLVTVEPASDAMTGLTFRGHVGQASFGTQVEYNIAAGDPGEITVQDEDFIATPTAAVDREIGVVALFDDETDKHFHCAGVKLHDPAASVGMTLEWNAAGGANSLYFLPRSVSNPLGLFTDDEASAGYQAFGVPNVTFIFLGINIASGEGSSAEGKAVYKTNMEAVALRAKTLMEDNGAADPLVVLVSQHTVSDDQVGADARSEVLREIAEENDYTFIDLNRMLVMNDGAFASWSGTYLSDDIHQAAAGTLRFAQLQQAAWRAGDQVGQIVSTEAAAAVVPASDIASAISTLGNLQIISPASGSTLDLFKGDGWSSNTLTITKAGAAETHWPTTLSTVHFFAKPKDRLTEEDSSASGVPAIVTFASVTCSGTTATGTLPTGHGLTTGTHAIAGAAQHEVNGYRTVTISSNTATWTMPATATTATGTITIQPGIACTVTQATGNSQAFTFAPSAAQLQRLSDAVGFGYTAWFVANAVTEPRVVRPYSLNGRPSPV